jgi:hypothetical protein
MVTTIVRATAVAVVACGMGSAARAMAESPAASFLWYPSAPQTGESISLASTSTDLSSPITNFAWDLTGNGTFVEAGPVTTTTFAAPGEHVVRLRVTAADGSSSIGTETIQVTVPPAGVLLPVPIVRIVGAASASGFKMRLLSVEAPPGAGITIACAGRGCPVRSESTIATSTGVGAVTLRFRRFERALPAGVVLEIRVSKIGEIGKYTRLLIRHRRPPTRLDNCLDPAGILPMTCPS